MEFGKQAFCRCPHLCFRGGMLLAANLVPLKGVVKDASGEPLAGVTVRIKDGKSGTITDVNGHFVLDVEKGKNCY